MRKEVLKRLNEITALRRAAKERGDWRTVHELDADWSFVFRQSLAQGHR